MKRLHRVLPALGLVTFIAGSPSSATATTAIAIPDAAPAAPNEEVVINGQRESLRGLRQQIESFEVHLFDVYNRATTIPDFEVHCRASNGSRIGRLECVPRFVDEASTVMVWEITSGHAAGPSQAQIDARLDAYQQHFRDTVLSNPTLRNLILEHAALVKHYEDVRREKFKGRWIVWD